MDSSRSLAGQLLVAMPGMTDPNFKQSVTYICEHTENGALGLLINQPMDMAISEVLEQLDMAPTNASTLEQPVLRGGPVQIERGFVLHEASSEWDSTTEVGESIYVTTSSDILADVASGKGPDKLLIALGYSGWDAGQLEAEILQNAWLTVPASRDIIFNTPFAKRWQAAAGSIGVNLASISPHAGHA
jgi:putative transcriptional regulator